MNRTRLRPARRLAAVVLLATLAALTGCFNPFRPLIGGGVGNSTPPPVPNSPVNILRLLEWCYNNRAVEEYREVFADDYRFVYSALDTNGNAYRDVPWTREDELISTEKLFLGGDATQPAATSISLVFDRNFDVRGDTRDDGITRSPRVHKSINTTVTLNINTADGQRIDVTGRALFFLVRGDSAVIPLDLPFQRDSTRWYIERWEDQTAQGSSALAPIPSTEAGHAPRRGDPAGVETTTPEVPPFPTWGFVKRLFR
jgi:hypothetical protein